MRKEKINKERLNKEKLIKVLKFLLLTASVLATIKVLFVDYTQDEEYQIVMAYRLLSGEHLFGTMWEPHQTSAFLCAGLMWLYEKIAGGTTGVVLFLRLVTTCIQAGLAVWLGRVLTRLIDREGAFLIGCCYFNMIPKIIQIPEFSNLQLWFFTVMILGLMQYYGFDPGHGQEDVHRQGSERNSKGWLVLAGIAMAGEVLAYPSCVILFFLVFVVLFRGFDKSGGHGWKDCLIFTATCTGCAVLWLIVVLSKVPAEEFLRNVRFILSFDQTHDVALATERKALTLGRGLGTVVAPFAVSCILGVGAWVVWKRISETKHREQEQTEDTKTVLAVFLVLAAEIVQLFYWIVLQKGYEEPQLYLVLLLLGAAMVWKQADGCKKILVPGIWGGVITILAVVYMSDMDAWYAIPHGLLGTLFAAVVLVLALEKNGEEKQKNGRDWTRLLLFSLAFCIVFGKGFTLRAGNTETNSVLGIRGLIRQGPAAGIFTNYMQAYIMNCTYEDFEKYVAEGENCLIVTNMVGSAGTTPYLFRKNGVSHFSVVDPTSYDEKLLTYWELYPEKFPDVIVVDCWYGQLMEKTDSWIMQYIEDEYGYTSVEDGRYVRFYRRKGIGTE